DLGFWKVRLTGGEPTLRRDLVALVAQVAATPGVARVALSTNGHRLATIAGALHGAGLTSLNVSLDSLDPERFRRITGRAELEAVVAGIESALAAGIPSVKVNVVLQRGLGAPEVDRFLAWTERRPLTVRFIELMETERNRAFFKEAHLPAEEIRTRLTGEGWTVEPGGHDGPATNYRHPGHLGRCGLISAYEPEFCRTCNRLRVSAAAGLRPCLFGDEELPLRPLLQRDDQREELRLFIESAAIRKPAAHLLEEGRCGSMHSFAAVGG
ncbi:MAG TPA: radical SAM protein, partial [Anaeromyxobacteraceae bacterium]|nr:radical SAM protein [Anaeromyxobacteraceae bacterium]